MSEAAVSVRRLTSEAVGFQWVEFLACQYLGWTVLIIETKNGTAAWFGTRARFSKLMERDKNLQRQ